MSGRSTEATSLNTNLLNQLYQESLAIFRSQAQEQEIFYWSFFDPMLITTLAGNEVTPVIDQQQWAQCYLELAHGCSDATTIPPLDAIIEVCEKYQSVNIIPLVIGHYSYKIPTLLHEIVATHIDATSAMQSATPETINATLEEKTVFFAAAMTGLTSQLFFVLPAPVRGSSAKFILDSSLYLQNFGVIPHALEVDLGDGSGYRQVFFDEEFSTAYLTAGRKEITIRASIDDKTYYARSEILVEGDVPIPNYTKVNFASSNNPNKKYAKGFAYIFLGKGHATLSNPIIISEGFRKKEDNDLNVLKKDWEILNALDFATDMLARGIDIVLLCYKDATLPIEVNAGIAIECIRYVRKAGVPSPIVGGASMGGLITRYALAWLSKYGTPEERSAIHRYFSLDTPHLGANLPVCVQMGLADLASYNLPLNPAVENLALINSDASQQMLLYWWNNKEKRLERPSAKRRAFTNLLHELGDWSTSAVRYGVSNGSGNASQQNLPPAGERVLNWNAPFINAGQSLISAPGEKVQNTYDYMRPSGKAPYSLPFAIADIDSAPSGTGDFFRLYVEKLKKTSEKVFYNNACFIPTIGSLAMLPLNPYKQADLHRNLERDPSVSALKYFSTGHFCKAL